VNGKELSFEKGYLYLEEISVILFPYPSVFELLKLSSRSQDVYDKFLNSELKKRKKSQTTHPPSLKECIDIANHLGLSFSSLGSLSKERFSIILKRSLLEELKTQDQEVIQGEINSFFKSFFKIYFEEKEILLESEQIFLDQNELLLNFTFKKEEQKELESTLIAKEKGIPHPLLLEVLVKKQLQIKEGHVLLWRTPGAFLPLSFLLALFEELSLKNKENYSEIAYKQGRVACKRQEFFLSKSDFSLQNVIEQCELVGFGPLEWSEKGEEVEFLFKSPEKERITFLEHYALYVFKGIFEEFKGKASQIIEKKLSSKGLFFSFRLESRLLEDCEEIKESFQKQLH
jgi:hypothetical protein